MGSPPPISFCTFVGVKKLLKLLIGLMLIPFCWASSRTFYFVLVSSSDLHVPWVFPAGFLLAVLGFFLLPQAFRTYVLGHELSHALAGLLMGARVGKMKVSREGGHVELTKTNFIISLAPYFFPFYTMLVIALWFGIGFFCDGSALVPLWVGLIGLTWGFHIIYTLYMLTREQPDVVYNGRLFSYVMIYLANLFFVALWLISLGEMTFEGSWNILCSETARAFGSVRDAALAGWAQVEPLFRAPEARP